MSCDSAIVLKSARRQVKGRGMIKAMKVTTEVAEEACQLLGSAVG